LVVGGVGVCGGVGGGGGGGGDGVCVYVCVCVCVWGGVKSCGAFMCGRMVALDN
jgi:hypothetical protein